MRRNTAISLGVAGILISIIAIIALSAFNRLADLWLPVALVLATSVTELVKAAVEIVKATGHTMLDEKDKPDD